MPCRCTLCGTRALGDERHFVFDCPHFARIRRQFRSLYQDADSTMQCFCVAQGTRKLSCHCLAAILNVADDSQQRRVLISQCWLNGLVKFSLSLSLSRQAMMYLLTMSWFLAHTSLAMTPEHSATNGEYSSLRSARAGHSKSMCLSSPKAPERTEPYIHACGEAGADGGPAQLAANETPCEKLKILCNFAVLMGTSQ